MNLAVFVLLVSCCAQTSSLSDYSFEVVRLVDWEPIVQLTGGLEDQKGPFLIGDVRKGLVRIRNNGLVAVEVHVASKDCGCSRQPSDVQIWTLGPSEEVVMAHDLIIAGEENAVEITVSIVNDRGAEPAPVLKAVTSARGSKLLTASYSGVIRPKSGPPSIAIDFEIAPQYFKESLLPHILGFDLVYFEHDGTSGTGFYSAALFPTAAWPEFDLPPVQLRSWKGVMLERLICGSQGKSERQFIIYGFPGLGGECSIVRVPAERRARLLEAGVWGVPDARSYNLQEADDGSWSYDLFLPEEVLKDVGSRIVLCELWCDINGEERVFVEAVCPVFAR